MYRTIHCLFAIFLPSLLAAQMTPQQRMFDFQHLAATYAKYYAPYEWKRELTGFDLYDVSPWIDRVRRAGSDLEYWEIASQYVAALKDSHSQYRLPSNFRANIELNADLYDGKVLLDFVSRSVFPVADYPFQVGDEVISIDGRPAMVLVEDFRRFIGAANERAARREAATYLFFRPQRILPRAHEIGENAVVVVRLESGEQRTFEIPWEKTGVPLVQAGPVPAPGALRAAGTQQGYVPFLARLHTKQQQRQLRILGYGQRNPYFAPPSNFQPRLGRQPSHFHFSGTFTAGDQRIGYLRIPHFAPSNLTAAYTELLNEVSFLEQNTDGLVLDVSRNTGGGCYGDTALQLFIPQEYRMPGDEVRATLEYLFFIELELRTARQEEEEDWVIALLEEMARQVRQALQENRGRTGPLPFCSTGFEREPLRNEDGGLLAYTKPLILLVDEFTTSWGDVFASVIQDSGRGPLVGVRTNGAGGSVDADVAGFFSEGFTSFSITIGVRPRMVSAEGYPVSAYLENIGVHPDVPLDFMTRENLVTRGEPFVAAFTAAVLDEIAKKAQ